MTLSSMTGFARKEGSDATASWVWEMRSVNARGLDMRFKLAPGTERLEPKLRRQIVERKTCRHGCLEARVELQWASDSPQIQIQLMPAPL